MNTTIIRQQIMSFKNSDRADKSEMIAYWQAKLEEANPAGGKYNSPAESTRDSCGGCGDYGVWTNRYGKYEDCE